MISSKLQNEFTVSINDKDRNLGVKMTNILREYGVLVITDVFSVARCNSEMDKIVNAMKIIEPKLKIDTIEELQSTWKTENLFPQTRKGLHQRGYSFLGWEVRQDPLIAKIFKILYSNLRKREINSFVTSIDAINIRPPIAPFFSEKSKDWPHIDQTKNKNADFCIQAQMVLTNTSASFRCSPRSHKLFNDPLLREMIKGKASDFYKFNNSQIDELKEKVENIGGEWQKAVIAPAGSLICWFSSTIHSAKLADAPDFEKYKSMVMMKNHTQNESESESESEDEDIDIDEDEDEDIDIDDEEEDEYIDDDYEDNKYNRDDGDNDDDDDRWRYWRGVVYVCHRPKEDVKPAHLKRLQKAYENNRTTNHWGSNLFPITPRFFSDDQYSKSIAKYTKNPELIYNIAGIDKPKLSELGLRLIGLR